MTPRRYHNHFMSNDSHDRLSLVNKVSYDPPADKSPGQKRALLCPMASSDTVQHRCGQITHIDSDTGSIAVELSMSKKFLITLKGKLAPDVQFGSRGHLTSILDFKIGDVVTIHWRNTEEGATILAILPNQSAQIVDYSHIRSSSRMCNSK